MISEKDGIHIQLKDKFVADSRKALGDVNIASHAHMDHAFQGDGNIVCSELTKKLLETRLGRELKICEHPDVELIDSGHILGSKAALIQQNGERILYTGDVSLQERAYMKGFNPPKADKLVIESTYGISAYRLPSQKEVEKRIQDWIQDTVKTPYLFGYSLGKAQKIQYIIQQVTDRPIVAHGTVKKMNDAIEKSTNLEFTAKPYGENKDLLKNGDAIFIGPTSFAKTDALNKLVKVSNGIKTGFSGWAATSNYKYRGGYDKVFTLSDHCGFDDLNKLVEKVDPEKVYTHHGFDSEFASYLKRKEGINARALKENQASLTDF